jgi:hypothetical protein
MDLSTIARCRKTSHGVTIPVRLWRPKLAGVLGNDRGCVHRFLEETGTDLTVTEIREEALFAVTVRKRKDEETIDLMTRLALQRSSDIEVVTESASGGLKQWSDFLAISSVLFVIENEQVIS